MGYLEEMEKYKKTEKQKTFDADFLERSQWEGQEQFWDTIEISEEFTEQEEKFEVKAEDMKAYTEGVPDDNPVFYDEEYAKKCGYDGLVAHPLFSIQVGFYMSRKGSWIRTPGARNPGQIMEWYDPIRVGDVLTSKGRSYDKWIKRGKYYMRSLGETYDQYGNLKMRTYGTLILPGTKADVLRFQKGEHALEK